MYYLIKMVNERQRYVSDGLHLTFATTLYIK